MTGGHATPLPLPLPPSTDSIIPTFSAPSPSPTTTDNPRLFPGLNIALTSHPSTGRELLLANSLLSKSSVTAQLLVNGLFRSNCSKAPFWCNRVKLNYYNALYMSFITFYFSTRKNSTVYFITNTGVGIFPMLDDDARGLVEIST